MRPLMNRSHKRPPPVPPLSGMDIEEIDEVSEERLFQLLQGDHYWHDRIKRAFAHAGMATRRILREEEHPIWQVWLTRQTFALSPEKMAAIRQLRKILADNGIKVRRNEFDIIHRRGDKIRCVFLLDLGRPVPLRACRAIA